MNFLKRILNNNKEDWEFELPPKTPKSSIKPILDKIQNSVQLQLKEFGFKKSGRSFRRLHNDSIYQIINFQSGQYPIGENYEVPGLRESLYGYFTINLGVLEENYFKLLEPEHTGQYHEYHCLIRERLSVLTKGKDHWWPIIDSEDLMEEISNDLLGAGFKWFEGINSIELIYSKLGKEPYSGAPRDTFDAALIKWQNNISGWDSDIRSYIENIPTKSRGHMDHILDTLKKLNIDVA